MFARLIAHLQLRRSTAFLLERDDDHLLDDIGLTRAELIEMRRGKILADALVKVLKFHSLSVRRGLPAAKLT